jgi:hypothetical protein
VSRAILLLALCAAVLAGCGSGSKPKPEPPDPNALSDRLVDFSVPGPYVNALDIDTTTGDFLVTTNKGFWRIDAAAGKVTPVKGTVEAQGQKDTVGTFLEIEAVGNGRLYGSGHPDNQGTLPQFLGFMVSEDSGLTWRSLSRLGDADLHKIITIHNKLYAFDAVLGAILISSDGGRTFKERFTPRGLVIDFVVDPEDPDHILAATEDQLYTTSDGGERWRPLSTGVFQRLAWTSDGTVVRAEQDGTVTRSSDGGNTFEPLGKVPGEPYKLKTTDDPNHLYLALSDATLIETQDGGRTWKALFKP